MEHNTVALFELLLCLAMWWPSETPIRRLIAFTQAVSGVAVASVVLAVVALAVIGLLFHK